MLFFMPGDDLLRIHSSVTQRVVDDRSDLTWCAATPVVILADNDAVEGGTDYACCRAQVLVAPVAGKAEYTHEAATAHGADELAQCSQRGGIVCVVHQQPELAEVHEVEPAGRGEL